MNYQYLNILGTMSGTSLDGIDISVVRTNGLGLERLNKNFFFKFNNKTQKKLSEFIQTSQFDLYDQNIFEIEDLITKEYINAISRSNFIDDCDAIGFHGQTIYHNPKEKISIQIGNPKKIANFFNKKIIYNFRQNDLVMGGVGAPLAPIYHKFLIENLNVTLPACFVNIGGISNITYWDGDQLIGFDTGPGNCLIDKVVKSKYNIGFDKNGEKASTGKLNNYLLHKLLDDQYFKIKPPKSLDKNYFDHYLEIDNLNEKETNNLLSTLCEFTILTIEKSLNFFPKLPKTMIYSGGGVNNLYLINKLKKIINIKDINLTHKKISTDFIEAELIAYLTARSLHKLPLTFPNTTGVSKPLSGGLIYNPKENH